MKKRERNREFGVGTRVLANEKAPGGYRTRLGTVREIVLGSRYGVAFDNKKELTVYFDSECLDRAPQVRTT
jgi:hypothetical protein